MKKYFSRFQTNTWRKKKVFLLNSQILTKYRNYSTQDTQNCPISCCFWSTCSMFLSKTLNCKVAPGVCPSLVKLLWIKYDMTKCKFETFSTSSLTGCWLKLLLCCVWLAEVLYIFGFIWAFSVFIWYIFCFTYLLFCCCLNGHFVFWQDTAVPGNLSARFPTIWSLYTG